jgi:hypothetical protein
VAVDVENPYPYGMSEMWEIPRYEDAIQKKVVELLKLLFTQDLNDGMEDLFRSVLIWYTILSSLRQCGEWRLSSVIMQVLAVILFTGHLTIGMIMLELKSRSPGIKLSL